MNRTNQTKTLTSRPPRHRCCCLMPSINGQFLCRVPTPTNGAFLSSNWCEGLKNHPKIWRLWSIFSKLCNSKAFCIQRMLKTKWATRTSFTIRTAKSSIVVMKPARSPVSRISCSGNESSPSSFRSRPGPRRNTNEVSTAMNRRHDRLVFVQSFGTDKRCECTTTKGVRSCLLAIFFFSFTLNFLRKQTKIIYCNFVNLKRINWKIHLFNNLSTLLSLQISPIWEN